LQLIFISLPVLPALSFFLFIDPEAPLFASLSSLLAILRRRDDRRSFCSPNHWLVREVHMLPEKMSYIL
jgi:hypothetical protein